MTDPQVKNSEEANHTVMQKAFQTDLDTFAFLNSPERSLERKLSTKAMATGTTTQPTYSMLAGKQEIVPAQHFR